CLLQIWKEECLSYKNQDTLANQPEILSLFSKIMKEDMSLDSMSIPHPTYSNLNALQYAAFNGDIHLLEQLVARGAALDYTYELFLDPRKEKTPPGNTALLMAVVSIMFSKQCLMVESEEKWRKEYENRVECAVQLVRLGANVNARLQLPTGCDANSKSCEMMKLMKLVGKSVRQLAPETGSELLVQTIESFHSEEDKIKLVNCRCGSRLSWKLCHSGKSSDPHYQKRGDSDQGDGKIVWRFSPLSPCPCKNTQKIYYKCCWEEPSCQ
ncbi:hypothetical protein ACHAXR_000956, partial [Thalassiosira sp. AJA248-18]